MTDPEIRNRFMILTWVVGVTAALVVAMLGNVISLSYQVGQINGQLNVLINHVTLK
jgi:hypothetical protein